MATDAAADVSFGRRFHRCYLFGHIKLLHSYDLYRTAENNQRHLSHGFKNISFRDNMYVDQSRPLSVFLVKAELRKFGEVRSHPPHPPWLRHWVGTRLVQ